MCTIELHHSSLFDSPWFLPIIHHLGAYFKKIAFCWLLGFARDIFGVSSCISAPESKIGLVIADIGDANVLDERRLGWIKTSISASPCNSLVPYLLLLSTFRALAFDWDLIFLVCFRYPFSNVAWRHDALYQALLSRSGDGRAMWLLSA